MPDPPISRDPSPTKPYHYRGHSDRIERPNRLEYPDRHERSNKLEHAERSHHSELRQPVERYTAGPQYPRHLPQSKSDGNVKSFEDSIQEDTAFATRLYGNWGSVPNRFAEQQLEHESSINSSSDHDRRGRHRSRSPVKKLEDVDEDNPLEFLVDTPRRRSRSPHKKLFGENGWLGRSPDIAKDNKKTVFKGLSERFKQRVEDIVSSQNTIGNLSGKLTNSSTRPAHRPRCQSSLQSQKFQHPLIHQPRQSFIASWNS